MLKQYNYQQVIKHFAASYVLIVHNSRKTNAAKEEMT